uniref:Uncharacterized protein n=1 Tax=Manihot esculenta TaxID=3983 RepID=A0A2C9U5R8_MANES
MTKHEMESCLHLVHPCRGYTKRKEKKAFAFLTFISTIVLQKDKAFTHAQSVLRCSNQQRNHRKKGKKKRS